MKSLDQILQEAPVDPGTGDKRAFYSAQCCWWASDRKDVDTPGVPLPCCPHCRSPLFEAPLEDFIKESRANPEHFGRIENFIAAHHANSTVCWQSWEDYEVRES